MGPEVMGLDVMGHPDLTAEALAQQLVAQIDGPVPMGEIVGSFGSKSRCRQIGDELIGRLQEGGVAQWLCREDGSWVRKNERLADRWRLWRWLGEGGMGSTGHGSGFLPHGGVGNSLCELSHAESVRPRRRMIEGDFGRGFSDPFAMRFR
jgi:hypothetical protein